MKHPAVSAFAFYSETGQHYLYIDRSDPTDYVARFTRDPLRAFLWDDEILARNYLAFGESHWEKDLRVVNLVINVERCAV